MIVEDNPADLLLIREAIDGVQIEAELHSVRDGDAATQFFDAIDTDANEQVPNLVLLDMNLPKKGGEEVLRHLRASSKMRKRACSDDYFHGLETRIGSDRGAWDYRVFSEAFTTPRVYEVGSGRPGFA
jgi:CheY-like chemotaxis protein